MQICHVGHQKAAWFWSWLLCELCFIDCYTIDNKQRLFSSQISLMWPHLQRESALDKNNACESLSFAMLHCYPFKVMLDYDLSDTEIEMIEITKYWNWTTPTHPQSCRFDLKHSTLSGAIIMHFGCWSECILLKSTQNIVCIPDVSLSTSSLKHLMVTVCVCASNLL